MNIRRILVAFALAFLAGCVVYDPYYPHPYGAPPSVPAAYDRSWNAAVAAMVDQGVEITRQDRGAGVIEGRRGSVGVNTRIVTQADGRIRVETNTSDANLAEGLSRAYDARMGR